MKLWIFNLVTETESVGVRMKVLFKIDLQKPIARKLTAESKKIASTYLENSLNHVTSLFNS